MNNTDLFDGYAQAYTVGRPDYSRKLIEYMYDTYGISKDSTIADIGSGTGKFAKHLILRDSEVYCVEPGNDMRQTAEKELSQYANFHSIAGDAENTTLPDNSVDFITSAQAFHWFDVAKFKEECRRILRPNGRVFLIWNIRDMEDPVNINMYEINKKYCPDFRGFGGGIERDDQRIKQFFDNKYERISFDHLLLLDKETFIARCLSGSYSLKEDDPDFDEYLSQINAVFAGNSDNGIISIGNTSVAYVGTP